MSGMKTPVPFIAPEVFDHADAALARVQAIYTQSVTHLRQAMQRFVAGDEMLERVRACYPCVRLETATDWVPPDDAEAELLSYGFVASAGSYATTLTRPDLFAAYTERKGVSVMALPPAYLRQIDHAQLLRLRLLVTAGEGALVKESQALSRHIRCVNS